MTPRDHRVPHRWEIFPVLVHRERRAYALRFLKELAVVQNNVWPEEFRRGVEEALVLEGREPAGGIILHLVRVDDDRVRGPETIHGHSFPLSVHVFIGTQELRDDMVEILLQNGDFRGGEDVFGEVIPVLIEEIFDLAGGWFGGRHEETLHRCRLLG